MTFQPPREDVGRLAHDRLHDVAISYASVEAGASREELRQAFEAYCSAIGANNDKYIGTDLSYRSFAAGRIVIDTIHALSVGQTDQLERELKRMALDTPLEVRSMRSASVEAGGAAH